MEIQQVINMEQNIYDNPEFFKGYYLLRNRGDNYNDLLEQPAMSELLPDLKGKSVLDLGCGFGRNSIDFVKRGARRVVGIDISEKMLDIAKNQSSDNKIEYINMSMAELERIDERFDFVYSSLAFHYVENFNKLIRDIYNLLNRGGELQFSQEHPIVTATKDTIGGKNNYDENGNAVSYTFSNYNESGRRVISWFIDGVEKYHRTIGEILTFIADTGFIIKKVCETCPKKEIVAKYPFIKREYIKPNFLIVKAKK